MPWHFARRSVSDYVKHDDVECHETTAGPDGAKNNNEPRIAPTHVPLRDQVDAIAKTLIN
ncbi:uncharacterized protein ACHE_10610A [Aspergillus chevalieri]|uniref:Uncharacterized protein n=1 Tax=Aspergillus chevalieri TaxID=182096 RepID=A0A7R7ZIF9_ASPCH|nr:uncharacterized protein ACHE_10610A [Aspergillus chevalieri]BCR83208.1 hypothetical protein ACHE_10610A [Aspergillus chevalieri]